MTRRLAVILGSVLLAAIGTFSISSPAKAECPYVPPYPPVTEAARSAREIIVGTVIENVGGQTGDFRLRIDHVLRGSSTVGDIRRIRFLYPNWPQDTFANGQTIASCNMIAASSGEVIAMAFGALAPDGKTRYTAISWISGGPENGDEFETTTLAKLQALADLPQTDTAPESIGVVRTVPSGAIDPPVVVLIGLCAGIATVLWLKRRQRMRIKSLQP
jgi:hypothetical protein